MNTIAIKPKVPDFEKLVNLYLLAKAELTAAKSEMEQAEAALLKAVGHQVEGSSSFVIADKYKITTTGKINRTISAPLWNEIKNKIPEPLANRLVQYKPSLNLRELRYVELNEQDWFKIIAPAITAKPAKPSIEVKEV